MNAVKDLVVGFFIGVANIIPGVSGGTFLLIFGIYERVIKVLNNFGSDKFFLLLKQFKNTLASGFSKDDIKKSMKLLTELDVIFILRILAGALGAILVLSELMKYFLTNQFSYTYAFFFGLITASIIIPVKLIKRMSPWLLITFSVGLILTLIVAVRVNPYDKVKQKSDMYKKKYTIELSMDKILNGGTADTAVPEPFTYQGYYSVKDFAYGAFCGATAISAMVLPGISGSLVLILMGEYFEIINAISQLKQLQLDQIIFLSVVAIGMLLGLLLFAKLVDFVFKKYYDMTMSFLTGLMVGSLYTLWPFKKFVVLDRFVKNGKFVECIENSKVYTNINTLPSSVPEFLTVLSIMIFGAVIMYSFIRKKESFEK